MSDFIVCNNMRNSDRMHGAYVLCWARIKDFDWLISPE